MMTLVLVLSLKTWVHSEWGCSLFWSDSIVFNESSIAGFITALTLTLNVKESSHSNCRHRRHVLLVFQGDAGMVVPLRVLAATSSGGAPHIRPDREFSSSSPVHTERSVIKHPCFIGPDDI